MINSYFKSGGWHNLYPEDSDMPFSDLRDIISTTYIIEDEIRDQKDKSLPKRNLTLSDLTMKVQYEKGELMEVDRSCDMTYMLP